MVTFILGDFNFWFIVSLSKAPALIFGDFNIYINALSNTLTFISNTSPFHSPKPLH